MNSTTETFLPEGAGPEGDVSLQAALWLLELQGEADDPVLRQRWQGWLDAAPEHRQAWARLTAFDGRLRQLPAPLVRAPQDAVDARDGRRHALKTLGLWLAVGGMAWVAVEHRTFSIQLAAQRTAPGERRRLTLADGSRIVLNGASALDVFMEEQGRRLVLHAGEVHVETAHDPAARPFRVETALGRVLAQGTRFTVRVEDDERTHVAVYAGAVALHPRRAGASVPVILAAGQQAVFSGGQAGPIASVGEEEVAWVRGMLVARDMPLPDFVNLLARQSGQAMGCDPALVGLQVSGTYSLDKPEAALMLLARLLPIRLERRQHWWGRGELWVLPA